MKVGAVWALLLGTFLSAGLSSGQSHAEPSAGVARSDPSGVAADPVLVVAGDIACGPDDPLFGGGDPSACQMVATGRLAASLAPSYVLPIGDTQYLHHQPQGTEPSLADYRAGYGSSWAHIGDALPGLKVRPVAGNHEYGDLSENSSPPLAAARNYFSYFGPDELGYLPATVTSPANDWYSYDIPVALGLPWHVVALDSECAALPKGGASGGCAAGSPMETWLVQDLARHRDQCTIAYWHEPRWAWGAGGSESDPEFDRLWQDLVQHGVTASFHGHDHFYQHWGPLDGAGRPAAGGVSEFIVGSGGVGHERGPSSLPTGVLAQNDTEFGVLALTLHATDASYAFTTTSGAVRDSGSLPCPKGATPPTVRGVAPIAGPAAGRNRVAVTGTGFAPGATTVRFGTRAAWGVNVTSTRKLWATVPSGSRTVDVRVTTGAGTSPVAIRDEYTYTLARDRTVTLSASTTSPGAGSTVRLSASSTKPSTTGAGLTIYDASTKRVLTRVVSGTTAAVTVARTGGVMHRFVAYVDDGDGGGLLAMSSPVIVTWQTAVDKGGLATAPY